jgi:hypothetical protein
VESDTTKSFWRIYRALPELVCQQAQAAYTLFRANPRHPSLQFKCVNPKRSMYSARVGLHYRVIGYVEDDRVTWWWIGTHGEYDKLLDEL